MIDICILLIFRSKVRLDGQDIRFLDRRWLRRQIGIVHKNPEFFNTSIADNIANGKGESTLKEIVRAAKDAGAHEFIMALPNVSSFVCTYTKLKRNRECETQHLLPFFRDTPLCLMRTVHR